MQPPSSETSNLGILPPIEAELFNLKEIEKRTIRRALRATNGSVGRAAKLLGIGRATLYRRLAEMEL